MENTESIVLGLTIHENHYGLATDQREQMIGWLEHFANDETNHFRLAIVTDPIVLFVKI